MARHFVFFLILFSSVFALATPCPTTQDPTVDPDPLVYLDDALTRAKQFVPNARFHRIDSNMLSGFNGFCGKQAWRFTFVDPVAQDLVYVDVQLRDDSAPGGAIHCATAYNVRIEHDYLDLNLIMKTLADPRSKLGISFDRALELLQNLVKRHFVAKSVSIQVMDSDEPFIRARVYVAFSDVALSYEIDMTHGVVEP